MWIVGKFGGIAKQIGRAVLVLLLVTFGITVIVRLLPGDPVTSLLPFGTPEQHDVLRKELGLDVNIFQYYWTWLKDFVRGDFGQTYTSVADGGVAVRDQIGLTLPRTLFLMLYTTVFSLIVSIPLGIFLAYKADTRTDKSISNTLFAFASIPNFAVGLALAYILGVQLELVNPVGYVPLTESVGEHFKSMVMPVLALSIGLISTFTRLLRVDTIATLKEDFVTMASSKGLSNQWILWRHVLRPSSLTLLTSAALNMGALIGGAVVVESVFAFDGLGTLIAQSIYYRQYLAIQSLIALVAVAYIVFNVIVDILYGVIDPRVRSHRGA